jgi:hypothetical protein
MTPNALDMHILFKAFKNIAKWYFQDFGRQLGVQNFQDFFEEASLITGNYAAWKLIYCLNHKKNGSNWESYPGPPK